MPHCQWLYLLHDTNESLDWLFEANFLKEPIRWNESDFLLLLQACAGVAQLQRVWTQIQFANVSVIWQRPVPPKHYITFLVVKNIANPNQHRPVQSSIKMLALINRLLDWFKSLFWKEEMELTLVGLQYSGKTTFVNVIAVSICG